MTRYHPVLQGTPKAITKIPKKMTRQLFWDHSGGSPIAQDILYEPKDEERRGIVDTETQNETILLTQFKKILGL